MTTNEPTADTGTPPATPPPVRFAGKYDSPEAFETGARNGFKAAGMPISDKVKLYGEGGVFADLASAEVGYKAIERTITAKGKDDSALPPMPEDAIDEESGIEELLGKSKVDVNAATNQFLKHGKLTDEQYASIQKVLKVSRKVIDSQFQATADVARSKWANVTSQAEAIAGGKEQLQTLVQWASTNVPKEILDTLKKQVEQSPDFYPEMIENLAAKYARKNGGAVGGGNTVRGQPATNAGAITSREDWRNLSAAVNRGDVNAIARLRNLDLSDFMKL